MVYIPRWITSRRAFFRAMFLLSVLTAVAFSTCMAVESSQSSSGEPEDNNLQSTKLDVDAGKLLSTQTVEDIKTERGETTETGADILDESQLDSLAASNYLSKFEIFLALLCGIYAVMIVRGYTRNRDIVCSAVAALKPLLEPQFSTVGIAGTDGKSYHMDGPAHYYFYASGRLYADGMIIQFNLQRRMDMFATLLGLVESAISDRCVFTLPLSGDFAMEPISLLLMKRKELARHRESNSMRSDAVKSVETLAGIVTENVPWVSGSWTLLADHADVPSTFLQPSLLRDLNSVAESLQSVHITDSGASWDPESSRLKRFVRLEFDLPGSFNSQEMGELMKHMVSIAMSLVDTAANAKLTSAARVKAVELRRKIQIEEQKARMKKRQEELEDERAARRKEEDERVSKMSASQQAKFEEKKQKKEYQRRIKKITK